MRSSEALGRTNAQPERPTVVLPPDYVAEYVDLGYATTAHRAQGVTVDTAHVLAAPGMPREALYVAMTRGRDANHVYVTTTPTGDPGCDGAPQPATRLTVPEVLTGILATPTAGTSATQTIHAAAEQARSLRRLVPIRATLAATANRQTAQDIFAGAGLGDDIRDNVLESPASGPLLAALTRADSHRRTPSTLLRAAAHGLTGPDADPVEDIAAVLHHRITHALDSSSDPFGRSGAEELATPLTLPDLTGVTPVGSDLAPAINQLDKLIRRRLRELHGADDSTLPSWIAPAVHDESTSAAATVAVYRDLYGHHPHETPHRSALTDDADRRRRNHAAAAQHAFTRNRQPDRSPQR